MVVSLLVTRVLDSQLVVSVCAISRFVIPCPAGLTVDKDGYVYVCSSTGNEIVVLYFVVPLCSIALYLPAI